MKMIKAVVLSQRDHSIKHIKLRVARSTIWIKYRITLSDFEDIYDAVKMRAEVAG